MNPRTGPHWLTLGIVLLALGSSCASAGAARVALLGDPRVKELVTLAEAEVGQGHDLQVVERQQVDRVLGEQKLSLSGLVDPEQAVAAGKVLSADLLAVVESDPHSPVAGLVVFDTGTGVRLCDRSIDTAAGANAAHAIAGYVVDAAAKRARNDSLHRVCLMTVRNGDLPRDMDSFCDAVGRLVERQLVGSANVALLERSRLEQVTRERALSGGGGNLLDSLTVLELEIDRDGPAGLRATSVLTSGTGKSLGKLTVGAGAQDADELARAVASQLLEKFNVPAGGEGDRAIEAARFARESELRHQNGDFIRALAPAEAAHALMPRDLVLSATLARALIFHGRLLYEGPGPQAHRVKERWPDPRVAPPTLLRGASLIADLAPQFFSSDGETRAAAAAQFDRATDELCDFLMSATLSESHYKDVVPIPSPDIAAAKASLRRYLLAQDDAMRSAIKDEASFNAYSKHLASFFSDDTWIASSSADEWTGDLVERSGRWLDLKRSYPGDFSADVSAALDAIAIDWQFEKHRKISIYRPVGVHRSRRWDPSPAGLGQLDSLVARLKHDPSGILREYGDLCSLSTTLCRDEDSPDEMRDEVSAYIAAKEQAIGHPALAKRPDIRLMLYRLMSYADQTLDRTPFAGQLSDGLMDFCLSRKDIDPVVIHRGLTKTKWGRPTGADAERWAAALRRILAVLDSPQCVVLYGEKEKLQQMYRRDLSLLGHTQEHAPGVATTQPGTRARNLVELFDAEDGLQFVFHPVPHDRAVYALGGYRAGQALHRMDLKLLRFSLDGNSRQELGTTWVDDYITKQGKPNRSGVIDSFAQSACIGEGRYCTALWRHGLFLFPLAGGDPEVVDERAGLPTNAVHLVAVLDGKVYAGLGIQGNEGYIVSYDLATHAVDVLASGIRKEKRSPFDDGETFEVRGLVADPPRHRLIVAVQRLEDSQQVNGVWEYKPATAAWRQLLPMRLIRPTPQHQNGMFTDIARIDAVPDDKLLIVANVGYYLYDLVVDRATVLFQRTEIPQGLPEPVTELPRYERETAASEDALAARHVSTWGESTLVGNWLWDNGSGSRPWGRCNLKTGAAEDFPTLRQNPYSFHPHYLRPIGDGSQMLAGDDFGLWILQTPDQPERGQK